MPKFVFTRLVKEVFGVPAASKEEAETYLDDNNPNFDSEKFHEYPDEVGPFEFLTQVMDKKQ